MSRSTFHFVAFRGKQRPFSLSLEQRGALNSAQSAFKSLSRKNPEQPEALVVPLLLGFPQNKGSVFLGRAPEASARGGRWEGGCGNVTLRDVIRRGCDMWHVRAQSFRSVPRENKRKLIRLFLLRSAFFFDWHLTSLPGKSKLSVGGTSQNWGKKRGDLLFAQGGLSFLEERRIAH